jgi:hypothetical protein
LAGESAANKVNCSSVGSCIEFRYVVVNVGIGEVPAQNVAGLRVNLTASGDLHPCPLKAEIEAAHAGEEAKGLHIRRLNSLPHRRHEPD